MHLLDGTANNAVSPYNVRTPLLRVDTGCIGGTNWIREELQRTAYVLRGNFWLGQDRSTKVRRTRTSYIQVGNQLVIAIRVRKYRHCQKGGLSNVWQEITG